MNRNAMKYSSVLASMLLTAMVAGCGTSNREGTTVAADVAKVSETTCAQCHGSSFSSLSGEPIYTGYVQSKHFINSAGIVVGCQDCHGGGSQHNGVGPIPFPNPDAVGKCWGCHEDSFLGKFETNQKPTAVEAAHFYNITGAGVHPAMYATTNFQKACTACHEPHNPINGKGKDERRAWATSGHGDVNGVAFATEDFKATAACVRCHTSTGFVGFAKSGWVVPTTTWATAGDTGREVLACSTCHNNDSFSVRSVSAFVAPYNNGANPKQFPDVGESNLCLACHSGRESADTVASVTDFTNASFKNSHYKAGAALMYMASGFDNFTTPTAKIGSTTYLLTMTPDIGSVPTYGIANGVKSTHRNLGTTAINGDSHNPGFFVPGVADANGPCVTCHLNVKGTARRAATGHSWDIDVNAAAQLCINCHASEVGVGGVADATALQNFLEEQAVGFDDALALISNLFLTNYGIKYNGDSYPYFYDMTKDPSGKTAVKDWTRGTKNQAFGKRLMGAAFNLNLLTKDPASYVHARTYARRLIYDTIDYLDDKTMNFSVAATAHAYDGVKYVKDTQAYTGAAGTPLFGTTTADMAYLLGWSRSNGTWSTPDRP